MKTQEIRKCGNCKHRCFSGWDGMIESCYWYEVSTTEAEEIKNAAECGKYEYGTPACLDHDEYTPSATAGDYGPGCPWNAPGMSVRDFI